MIEKSDQLVVGNWSDKIEVQLFQVFESAFLQIRSLMLYPTELRPQTGVKLSESLTKSIEETLFFQNTKSRLKAFKGAGKRLVVVGNVVGNQPALRGDFKSTQPHLSAGNSYYFSTNKYKAKTKWERARSPADSMRSGPEPDKGVSK